MSRQAIDITRVLKLLAVKFKLLGDVAVMVPALRAIREFWPEAELHVLVHEEATSVLENIPWIHKVWGVPKKLTSSKLKFLFESILKLRQLRFERSVDFEGNDRGAFLSLLIGAKVRLGSFASRGFAGRRHCYTHLVDKAPNGLHEVYRDLQTLSAWNIPYPLSLEAEVRPKPDLAEFAASILPTKGAVLAHLSTSQPKKEWPLEFWAEIASRANRAGIPLFFSSGVSAREKGLLTELKRRVPDAAALQTSPDLSTFIAVIHRAKVFVSGDTGPLHIAAGLKVPCIGIFGPSSIKQWLPMARNCTGLSGTTCACSGDSRICESPQPCIRGVTVDALWGKILELYEGAPD